MLSLKPLMTLLLATLLCACQVGSKDSAGDPLTQARQRWVDQGLQHYRYQIRQQCYCGQQALIPATVLVNGQQARLDSPDHAARAPLARTVEAWFDLIEEKQRKGWHQVDVDYHPQQGYPRHIRLDFDPRMADDEQQYWIENLVPAAARP